MVFIDRFNHLHGANTQTSPFLMSEKSLTVLNGCNVSHELGSILKDTGYVQVGDVAQANKSILGMFDFTQIPGTQKILITMNDATDDDTQLFYNNAGTWTEIGAAETAWANVANADVQMESFIAYCFFVGYNSTDGFLPVGSLTGTTFSTSTNVTNMAQGKYIKRYRDRLYVANARSGGTNYPFRVYFSSVPSSGAITWTPASDFFDIDYSDEITGIEANWDKLIIFTKKKAYFYDQQQKKKLWDRGCANARTIANSGIFMIWTDTDGVWMSQNGGMPQEISGTIRDFIKNGTPTNFFASVVDEEYNLYVGTVTVNAVQYSNCMLTYNIPTQTWRWRELAHDLTILAPYDDSGSTRLYMGDTTGKVFNKSKYTDSTIYSSDGAVSTTTDGTDIQSGFELAPFFMEPDKYKAIRSLVAYAERANGLQLYYRVLDSASRITTEYEAIGTIERFAHEFKGLKANPGTMLQVKGLEVSSLPYWSFFGARYDLIEIGEYHNPQ